MALCANVIVLESLAVVGFAFSPCGAPRRTIPRPENAISICYLSYVRRRSGERRYFVGVLLFCFVFVEPL